MNKDTMCRVYQDAQKSCGLKVGDYVRVTRKAEDYEAGWSACWNGKFMDKTIGMVGRIDALNLASIKVVFDKSINDWWDYPYFVLEKVPAPEEQKPKPEFEVGDYVKVVAEDIYYNRINFNKRGVINKIDLSDNTALVLIHAGENVREDGSWYFFTSLEKCDKLAEEEPPARKPELESSAQAFAYARRLLELKKGDKVALTFCDQLKDAIFTGRYNAAGYPCFLKYSPENKQLVQVFANWSDIVLLD